VHERAGDVAREYHMYEAAAQHYQDALQVPSANESAWMRLSGKLAEALWLGNEPGSANAINDRLLTVHRSHPERSADYVKTLSRVARQLWLDSRTKDEVPVLRKAIHIAELSKDPGLLQYANARMANVLVRLTRFQEANRYLRVVEQLHEIHNIGLPSMYYTQKGWVAVGFGQEKEAFAYFNRAIELLKNDADSYRSVIILSDYGIVALMFGKTGLAKEYLEHALLAARRNNIAWLIPQCCLAYADFLMRVGEYASARDYLLEALSSNARTHILDENIAFVGIPLALYMKDEATLAKCMSPHIVQRAFSSGEPGPIGGVAASLARVYVERGETKRAHALLHRAIYTVRDVMHAWELPLEIARSGAPADFPQARKLLKARAALPSVYVAEAHLQLFEAFVARREGRESDAREHARAAVTRFDRLQWSMYTELARSLLPVAEQHPSTSKPYATPFSDTRAKITEREREVAAFILKGMTNRAIADALSITENTIEKHVASVMNKLGIRSRHQLADAIYPSLVLRIP